MTAPGFDPYAHSREEAEFGAPEYAPPIPGQSAVPSLEAGAPYVRALGWAPALRLSPESIPDSSRLGQEPVREMLPYDGEQPEAFFRPLDADRARRHSVEYQDADGWEENKDFPGFPSPAAGANRFARNPRETPPAEPRPTSRLAPRTYLFTRPFMTGLAKNGAQRFNGVHFSMADNKRDFPILGMAPVATHRNTYRIDPGPWDTGLVDMPVNAPSVADLHEVPQTVEVAYQSRSWRL